MKYLTYKDATIALSVTLTTMLFNLILCILIKLLGSDKEKKSRGFIKLATVVLLGSVMTCAAVYTRAVKESRIPLQIGVLMHLLSIGVNILLTYYFARYIESFFSEQGVVNRKFEKINRYLSVAGVVSVFICYFIMLPGIDGTEESATLPSVYHMIVGYLIELYYLIYALGCFIRSRKLLDRRAYATLIAGFAVTITGIVLEKLSFVNIVCNYYKFS